MPELLGVTNPVPGYDSSLNNRNLPTSPGNMQIHNVPDPSRVTRADNRAEQQDAGAKSQTTQFSSNFQTFLQQLRGLSPELAATMLRLLTGQGGLFISSGMNEGVAQELSAFMAMLRMDREQFRAFLSNQMQSATRFGGALFSLLREAYLRADSDGLRMDILQFLKKYSDFSSTEHIEGNMQRNLNQMARAIPARFGNQLMEMIALLENGIKSGDRKGNLKLLQQQILPFMSEYVARTHDLGRARGLLSLLTLDISRYENGMPDALQQAFQLVKNHPALRDRLGQLDEQSLMLLLRNTNFLKAAQSDTFAAKLAQMAEQALRGAGGLEAQNTFRDLIASFLVNESVYMQVNHLIIPLEWQGKLMFSELWVDPDAENDSRAPDEEPTQRFLFKIDVQSLGFFDVVLTCRGSQVDIQVHCPEKVEPFSAVIEKNMTRILSENGFEPQSVRVKKMERPVALSEVFPKIFEGKDSVDVKI